jgi:putative ABC transport system permease protein
MSLALATLVFEWRRYLAAVIALAFSGLLVLAQVGIFTGILRAVTATLDRSRAELVIMPPRRGSLLENGPTGLPDRVQPQIYLNPEVTEVASFDGAHLLWNNLPGPAGRKVTQTVAVRVVDPRPGAVSLPVDYSEAVRISLMEPYAVAVDRTALGRLGAKLGDRAVLGGRTVRIAALLDGYADIDRVTVVMSRDTLRMLNVPGRSDRTGPLLVAIRHPELAEQVRDELNATSNGAYAAWTREDMAKANQGALVRHQIIGVVLAFSVGLSVLIGVGVTSQTLRGAIIANVKEFASLRALGVSMGALRLTVIELSMWVGLTALGVTAVLTWVASICGALGGVPMGFPPIWIVSTAGLMMVVAIVSGLMAMGGLAKAQPADLLR